MATVRLCSHTAVNPVVRGWSCVFPRLDQGRSKDATKAFRTALDIRHRRRSTSDTMAALGSAEAPPAASDHDVAAYNTLMTAFVTVEGADDLSVILEARC